MCSGSVCYPARMTTFNSIQQPLIADEYLRVSLDQSGEDHSPTEQHEDHVEWVEAGLGLHAPVQLRDTYVDRTSASKFATKARADYERLVANLRNPLYNVPNILIVWEVSRNSRKVRETAEVADLCEDRGVKLAVWTNERIYDLANGRDYKDLIDEANAAQYASWLTSKRVRRHRKNESKAGKFHGKVPYGYRRRYAIDPETNKRVCLGQEPEPHEAKVVRELFDRIAEGHSLRAIQIDFEDRGIRTRAGGVFSSGMFHHMLTRHVYAGLRVHQPGRKGARIEPDKPFQVTDGQWPEIVKYSVWSEVQRIMKTPKSGPKYRPGGAVHLLSHIVPCDKCGGPISGHLAAEPKDSYYRCIKRGCLAVRYHALNEYVEHEIVLAYLSDPRRVHKVTERKREDDGELEHARTAVAKLKEELDELEEALDAGDVSEWAGTARERGIRRRLEAAQEQLDDLERPSVFSIMPPGKDVAERWARASMATKRAVLRGLLTPSMLGELRVVPSPLPKGVGCPVELRVRLRRDGDD